MKKVKLFWKKSFQLLTALKMVNEHKQNSRIRRKKRLGIRLHSRMVGGCVGGHTQESLQIYIKNTAVFLQAVIFYYTTCQLRFQESCKPSS